MTRNKGKGIMNPESKKLLNTLIQNPEREFNKKELAEEAEISRDALYRRWDKFEQLVLEEKGSKYKLRDNSLVHNLKQIIAEIDSQNA